MGRKFLIPILVASFVVPLTCAGCVTAIMVRWSHGSKPASTDVQSPAMIASVDAPTDQKPTALEIVKANDDIPTAVDFDGRTWMIQVKEFKQTIRHRKLKGPLWICTDASLVLFDGRCEQPDEKGVSRIRAVYRIGGDGTLQYCGRCEWYFQNGERDAKWYDDKGDLHGELLAWFANGKVKLRETYHHGQLNGLSELFWSNGKVKYSAAYVNGNEMVGFSFNEDGSLAPERKRAQD